MFVPSYSITPILWEIIISTEIYHVLSFFRYQISKQNLSVARIENSYLAVQCTVLNMTIMFCKIIVHNLSCLSNAVLCTDNSIRLISMDFNDDYSWLAMYLSQIVS